MKTFVFEGTEVKKTGRTAVRRVKIGTNGFRDMILEEITPVAEFEWKKWVPPEQLYEVRE